MELYTCFSGKYLYDERKQFWAWDVRKGDYNILVSLSQDDWTVVKEPLFDEDTYFICDPKQSK